jgi:hypothetical protein
MALEKASAQDLEGKKDKQEILKGKKVAMQHKMKQCLLAASEINKVYLVPMITLRMPLSGSGMDC